MNKYEECKQCRIKLSNFRRQAKYRQRQFIFMLTIMIIVFGYLIWQVNRNIERDMKAFELYKPVYTEVPANPYQIYTNEDKIDVQVNNSYYNYDLMELPKDATGEFKTYMDYRKITNKTSKQWALQQLAETDENGFRVFNGKYLVAMGTYYSKNVGKEMRITLEDGKEIYVIIGDIKQDIHMDKNNQYVPVNGNIVEFIVDVNKLDPLTKKLGNVSNSGLEGKIIMIEEVIAYGE